MWSDVNFSLAAFGGFAAGYVMSLGAFWLESVIGMVRLDFGLTGVKYVGGEQPGSWVIGIIFHFIDSVLLGIAYGALVWPHLPALGFPTNTILGDIVGGVLFGIFLWVVLAMLIAMPMMGVGVFGYRMRSWRIPVLSLGLHIIYGILLGLVYIPG